MLTDYGKKKKPMEASVSIGKGLVDMLRRASDT
jgi:hypothetical protein